MSGYEREVTVLKPAIGGNFLVTAIPREVQHFWNCTNLKRPEH
jgi:hypothetical protein